MIDTPSDNATSMMMTLFNWVKDINTHWHLTGMNTTTAISNVHIPPPCNFSMLHLGTQNLWGTLSCHYHCHYHPQPPHDPLACNLDAQNPWSRTHRFNYHAPLNTCTWKNPEPNQPVPTYTIKTVCHPQGIGPTKPTFHTSLLVCHNVPPTPVQLVEAAHLSQSTGPLSGHTPTPSWTPLPPPPLQLVKTIWHPCRIVPTKPVIRTMALPPTTSPHTNPSMSAHVLVSTVSLDLSSWLLCDTLLDWSGDPLLAGLAKILEVLGWTRDHGAMRTSLFLKGGRWSREDCQRGNVTIPMPIG